VNVERARNRSDQRAALDKITDKHILVGTEHRGVPEHHPAGLGGASTSWAGTTSVCRKASNPVV